MMERILIVHDETDLPVSVEGILNKLGYRYSLVSTDEISTEFIVTTMVGMVIFELSTTNSTCITILEELEKYSELSGTKKCPIIIVAEESLHLEQTVRAAFSDFFFVKPVAEKEFALAIKQALSLTT